MSDYKIPVTKDQYDSWSRGEKVTVQEERKTYVVATGQRIYLVERGHYVTERDADDKLWGYISQLYPRLTKTPQHETFLWADAGYDIMEIKGEWGTTKKDIPF